MGSTKAHDLLRNFSQPFRTLLFFPFPNYSSLWVRLAKVMRQIGVSLVFPSPRLPDSRDIHGSKVVNKEKFRNGEERSGERHSGCVLELQSKSQPGPEAKCHQGCMPSVPVLFFSSRPWLQCPLNTRQTICILSALDTILNSFSVEQLRINQLNVCQWERCTAEVAYTSPRYWYSQDCSTAKTVFPEKNQGQIFCSVTYTLLSKIRRYFTC